MIRRLSLLLLLVCSTANAQFTPGQILTAAQLNSALAAKTSNSAAAITGGSITNATITGGTMSGTAITGGTISGLTSPLPVASGGTGATASTGSGNVVLATSPTIAGLTVTGSFTAPGLISPASLVAQAANTVLANVTASSASPTAVAMPTCNSSTSALQYTPVTGWTCYTNSATTTGTLAQFAATTSAQLAGVLSDETGSGSAVFGTSPTINTPTISGGTISNAPISGSTGSFTTLAASSTVSGTGFSNYLASPPAIGGTSAAAGSFTNLSSSGTVSGTGFTSYLASPPAIGGTTPAAGSFTTLSASSTVSGTGFSTYMASPPAIGTTTAAAGKFTTLQATSAITPAYPAGVIGNVSGSAITAGSIGETICAQVTNGGSPTGCASNVSTPVSLTTATSANVASITLTAGDWDIFANVSYNIGATTTINYVGASISSASVTMDFNAATLVPGISGSVATVMSIPAPTIHKSISSTTTFYLVTTQAFGTSTLSAFGRITAVRR